MTLPAPESADEPRVPPADDAAARARAVRRRRLDEVFGDVLPATTADERDTDADAGDSWYRANRPPHHDG